MKKSILFAIAVGFLTAPLAPATTVGFAAAPSSRSVVNQDLITKVAVGSIVRVGAFALSGSALDNAVAAAFVLPAGSAQDLVTRIQNAGGWTEFVTDGTTPALPLGISTVAGNSKVSGSVINSTTAASAFNGLAIYLWVFDSTSLAGAATSVQMGIYKATAAATSWLFPTNGSIPDSVSLSTGTVSTIVAVGGVGSVSDTQLQLEAVPEPSAALLSVMGLMAIASRRRRNRN